MIIVQKFGGASLATIANITQAVEKTRFEIESGNEVVVIVSAMKGTTQRLISLCSKLGLNNSGSLPEYDIALSSGETFTSALFALALQQQFIQARSLQSWQIPIHTSNDYSKATIINIDTKIITKLISKQIVPVISGFQGIDKNQRITTLGRSGSDITAIAVSAALRAARCDIYTDVEGVFSIDPALIKNTIKYDSIDYDKMFAMASSGAKVVHSRAVQLAMRYNIPIRVMSSFSRYTTGTTIQNSKKKMEQSKVKAITYDKNIIQVNIYLDSNNQFFYVIQYMIQKSVSIEQVIGSSSSKIIGVILHLSDLRIVVNALNELKRNAIISNYKLNHNIASISVIGYSINNSKHSALNSIINVINQLKVTIISIVASDIKISIILDTTEVEAIVTELHNNLIQENVYYNVIDSKIASASK